MSRPLIGISGWVRTLDRIERAGVNAAYVYAVARAGGVPVVLTQAAGPGEAVALLASLQGLVLTGGQDLHPERYGAAPSPRLGTTDPDRDGFELALFQAARESGHPVLGICRGLQLVNVAMGGTLWQDLPTERPGAIDHDPALARDVRCHSVTIDEGSELRAVLGTGRLETNSIHHQAIRDLAPGLTATARADDGVIEGVEGERADGWLLAVQWHPEEFHRLPAAPDQRLFDALVRAAGVVSDSPAGAGTAPGRLPG